LVDRGWQETGSVTARRTASVLAGFRFPPGVISAAVRWYLRYGLSYRDAGELPAGRGVTVDHLRVYRWVQRFTPEFIQAARPCRHAPGKPVVRRRDVPEGRRQVDLSLPGGRSAWPGHRRPAAGETRPGGRPALGHPGGAPARSRSRSRPAGPLVYLRVPGEPIPSALHIIEEDANNPIEADHGRLKARLRPMRGLKRHRSALILAAGHAFVQNLRRHYDIATEVPSRRRVGVAFDDPALAI